MKVTPAYNEAGYVLQLITSINLFAPNSKIDVINDSPNSKNSEALAEYAQNNAKLISRKKKIERRSAVLAGITQHMQYKFDYLLEIDAVFSDNPSEITNLISSIEIENSDLAIASQYLTKSNINNRPILRRVFSKIVNKLCTILFESNASGYANVFRLYSRRAIELMLNKFRKIGSRFFLLSKTIAQLNLAEYKIILKETNFKNIMWEEKLLVLAEVHSSPVGLKLIENQ